MILAQTVVPTPSYDWLSLPAPASLLEGLFLLTFWVHMIFVGLTLGGSLILAGRSFLFLAKRNTIETLDRKLVRAIPPILSVTITTGIAPLLFVQTLYGHFSYSSNILLGYFWLGSLVLLLVGFICLYLAGWLWDWQVSLPALAALPVCFLGILYIFTNNAILTIQPDHWLEFHRHTSIIHVKDAITIPRIFHNIAYSLMFGGLLLAWTAKICKKDEKTGTELDNAGTVSFAMGWFAMGAAAIILFSGWYYYSMPEALKQHMITDSPMVAKFIYLWLGSVGLAVVCGGLGMIQPGKNLWPFACSVLSLVVLLGMVLVREFIRKWYLAREVVGGFSIDKWHVATQGSAIVVFLVCLVAGLAIIGVMVVIILRGKPEETCEV